MAIWIIWLIVAVALGVAEMLTMTFSLGLIAMGAVAAAVVAAAGGGGLLQLGAFVLAALGGLVVVRPIALRHVAPAAAAAYRRRGPGRPQRHRRRGGLRARRPGPDRRRPVVLAAL